MPLMTLTLPSPRERGSELGKKNASQYLYPYKVCVMALQVNDVTLQAYPVATLGAGCFWGVEAKLASTKGVLATAVGYMGGTTANPTYQQVCTGQTGHAEVVHLRFDPEVLPYTALLQVFFALHDPTQRNRQGPDVGTQYRSVIFVHSPQQLAEAQAVMANLPRHPRWRGDQLATTLEPAGSFTFAETYHQRYWEKHPGFVCH